MKVTYNNILVELHVPDFKRVKNFYGALGFKVVWERKPEDKKGYLVMQFNKNILCFWPGTESVWEQDYFKNFPKDTKKGYGVEIVIMVDDIDNFYNRVKKFAKIVEELKTQPWGLKDFRAEDPFGFYLRFTEPNNILSGSNVVS